MTAVVPAPDRVDALRSELEAVRRALIEDAQADADRIIAEATREAALTADEAEREAAEQIRRAERRGAAAAQARADRTLARARGDAHGAVLQAQEAVRRRLQHAVQAAAFDLRPDPRYPELLNELERLARNQLGPTVQIERDGSTGGGITAIAGPRRVDYTLAALADRALDALAAKTTLLWA